MYGTHHFIEPTLAAGAAGATLIQAVLIDAQQLALQSPHVHIVEVKFLANQKSESPDCAYLASNQAALVSRLGLHEPCYDTIYIT